MLCLCVLSQETQDRSVDSIVQLYMTFYNVRKIMILVVDTNKPAVSIKILTVQIFETFLKIRYFPD